LIRSRKEKVRIRDFSYIRKKVFVITVAWLALFILISHEISDKIPRLSLRFPVLLADFRARTSTPHGEPTAAVTASHAYWE